MASTCSLSLRETMFHDSFRLKNRDRAVTKTLYGCFRHGRILDSLARGNGAASGQKITTQKRSHAPMVDKTSAVNSGDQEKTETVPENAEIRSLGPTDEELRSIANMTDAVALFGQNTTPVAISDVLGTGFSVLDKKDTLCDVPFLIISAGRHFSEENDGYFTTLHVVTETGEKFIVNDGGTGIHAQMEQLEKAMPDGGYLPMYVPRGLRVSKYEVEDDKGKKSQAKTYYLNTGK